MEKTYNVLNTIAASGADVALDAGKLTIANDSSTSTYSPGPISYKDIESVNGGVLMPLVETAMNYKISWTAGNSTTYKFSLAQEVNGDIKFATPNYTTDASGTDNEIGENLVAFVNKLAGFKLTASHTSGNAYITIETTAGYPSFTAKNISNVTVATNQPTKAPHGTAGTAIAGTSTVTVTTLAAHGLATGQTVTVSGVATMTLTQNGVSGLSSVTARITYATATTFTLDGVTASGTNSGTITITVKAQKSRGTYAVLVAAGVPTSALSSTVNYAQVKLTYDKDIVPVQSLSRKQRGEHVLYVSASLVASPYTATTNFAALKTKIEELFSAYIPGTTDVNPEAIAVN